MDFDTQSHTILEALDLAHRWQVHYVAWTEQGGGAEDWHFKGIRGGKDTIVAESWGILSPLKFEGIGDIESWFIDGWYREFPKILILVNSMSCLSLLPQWTP